MILGIQLYGLMANANAPAEDILRELSRIGINMVEPCMDFTKDGTCGNKAFWTIDRFEELYPLMKELGLDVISCHASTGADEFLDQKDRILDFVAKYKIRHLIMKMPSEYTEEAMQELAFCYREFADELAEVGTRILLHNGKPDVEVMIHGKTAYEYMCDICLGKVGLQIDVGWALAGGCDPIELLKRNMHRLESLHYKDFDDLSRLDKDVSIGTGLVDSALAMQIGRFTGVPQFIDQDAYSPEYCNEVQTSYDFLMNEGAQREHTVSYLNIYDTKTGTVKLIKKFDYVIEAPNWVNSLNSLIYNSDGHIYRFDLETKESTLINSGIADRCNNDHVISADEKYIAVSSDYETEDGGGSRIFILPIEGVTGVSGDDGADGVSGGEAKLATKNAPSYLHGWSPDKNELAYCAFRTVDGKQSVDIYTISPEGGEEKRITSQGFNDGPEYSPDGKHIWFISTESGLMQVYRMNRDGSNITQMTFEERNNWFGHVSPDCKRVVNLAYRVGDSKPSEHFPNMQVELWMMNYDGSDRKKILSFFGGQGSLNVNSWSGDSRYFAFVSYGVTKF